MTGTAPVLADEQDLEAPPPRRGSFVWSVIKGQPQATIGALVLLAFVLVALFAPVIAPYDPREKGGDVFEAPTAPPYRLITLGARGATRRFTKSRPTSRGPQGHLCALPV